MAAAQEATQEMTNEELDTMEEVTAARRTDVKKQQIEIIKAHAIFHPDGNLE